MYALKKKASDNGNTYDTLDRFLGVTIHNQSCTQKKNGANSAIFLRINIVVTLTPNLPLCPPTPFGFTFLVVMRKNLPDGSNSLQPG